MNESLLLLGTELASHVFVRGKVLAVSAEGVLVSCHTFGASPRVCDILQTSRDGTYVAEGDPVLVCVSSNEGDRDIVLGRIGSSGSEEQPTGTPDELVIEATKSLTLRVGAGSITIREDGKILIKGKDLVSHAQRLNRIKGGAVQIN